MSQQINQLLRPKWRPPASAFDHCFSGALIVSQGWRARKRSNARINYELGKALGQPGEALVEGVQEILGDNFVGAYLQGSFAVGDFDRHSDVDFIVVTVQEPAAAEVEGLQVMHGRVYDLESETEKHLDRIFRGRCCGMGSGQAGLRRPGGGDPGGADPI